MWHFKACKLTANYNSAINGVLEIANIASVAIQIYCGIGGLSEGIYT
jgi:hypothetical protein